MLRTKKQAEDICNDCSLAKTANLIGDTFSLLIIRDLLSKPKRFGELEKSLKGVSSRTICNKLNFLIEKELVKRVEFPEKPPRVVYSLTQNGKSLNKIISSMRSYGEKFL